VYACVRPDVRTVSTMSTNGRLNFTKLWLIIMYLRDIQTLVDYYVFEGYYVLIRF